MRALAFLLSGRGLSVRYLSNAPKGRYVATPSNRCTLSALREPPPHPPSTFTAGRLAMLQSIAKDYGVLIDQGEDNGATFRGLFIISDKVCTFVVPRR